VPGKDVRILRIMLLVLLNGRCIPLQFARAPPGRVAECNVYWFINIKKNLSTKDKAAGVVTEEDVFKAVS